MTKFRYPSKCPKCGNIDILTKRETERIVHCQRCYNHYEYKDEGLYFKGYKNKKFFNLE